MSTQLPGFLIAERQPRSNTKFYEWYNSSTYSAGKEYVWSLLDYLMLYGPTSNADLERALVKSSKKKLTWYDENGEEIKPKVEPVYGCKETLKRHLDGLVECHALVKEGHYYKINDGIIYFINTDFLHGKKYEDYLNKMKKEVRTLVKGSDLVTGVGTTLLFYNTKERELFEGKFRVQLALRIIDEANQLLRTELRKNGDGWEKTDYLVVLNQKRSVYDFNLLHKGFEIGDKTNEAMVPITEVIGKAVKEYESKMVQVFTLKSEWKKYIVDGPVNGELRKAFKSHGHPLSQRAAIACQDARKCVIEDDNNNIFFIEDTGKNLKICKRFGEEDVSFYQ